MKYKFLTILGFMATLATSAYAGGIHCDDDPKCLPCVPGVACHNSVQANFLVQMPSEASQEGGSNESMSVSRDEDGLSPIGPFIVRGRANSTNGDSETDGSVTLKAIRDAQKMAYQECSLRLKRAYFHVVQLTKFEIKEMVRTARPHYGTLTVYATAKFSCVLGEP